MVFNGRLVVGMRALVLLLVALTLASGLLGYALLQEALPKK